MRSATLVSLLFFVAGCSSDTSSPENSGAPSAAAQAQTEHETEVAKRFRMPEIRNYLMLPESFIGGTFPKRTAVLLREVEQLETTYVAHLQAAGASAQLIEAHQLLENFTAQAAELYELMSRQSSDTVKAMRSGLEISDEGGLWEYNRRVPEVNAAGTRLEKAIQALSTEEQASFRRMSVATRLK